METKPDAMQVMMRLSADKNRAKVSQDRAKNTNNDVLKVEQENDAAEKAVQELQRVLEPMRARTHAVSAHDDENFFGTPGHYCMRKYRCWYKTCSLVRGRDHDCLSRGNFLDVPGCLCSKLSLEGRPLHCAVGTV